MRGIVITMATGKVNAAAWNTTIGGTGSVTAIIATNESAARSATS